eukprot:2462185-Prymnesium_polylepis.1
MWASALVINLIDCHAKDREAADARGVLCEVACCRAKHGEQSTDPYVAKPSTHIRRLRVVVSGV